MESTPPNQNMVSQQELNDLYARLIEVFEKVANNLYRKTIEHLRMINPTLDQIANSCEIMIEVLEAAGNRKISQLSEVVGVIREAAVTVSNGGEASTVTDCAYHIDELMSLLQANEVRESKKPD